MKITHLSLGVLLLAQAALARDLFVAPAGSGESCSKSAPCAYNYAQSVHGAGDTMLLKRGGTYIGKLRLVSGTQDQPSLYTYWGDVGPRPIIEQRHKAIDEDHPQHHITFEGLHWRSPWGDPADPLYTGDHQDALRLMLLSGWSHITFHDNIIDQGELVIQAYNGGSPSHITLERNIFTGSFHSKSSLHKNIRPSNVYADGVSYLTVRENIFDYGGWHPSLPDAGANMYNHNFYGQHSIDSVTFVVEGNIFARGAAHGIQMRSGGTAIDNLFWQNTVSLNCGYQGQPMAAGAVCHVERNVFLDGKPMQVKGVAPCRFTKSCSDALWAIDVAGNTYGTYKLIDNIAGVIKAQYRKSDVNAFNRTAGLSFPDDKRGWLATVVERCNIDYGWSEEVPRGDYPDPTRDLGSYAKALGFDSAEGFIAAAKARPVGTWPVELSAAAVNDYVRAGFGMPSAVSPGSSLNSVSGSSRSSSSGNSSSGNSSSSNSSTGNSSIDSNRPPTAD